MIKSVSISNDVIDRLRSFKAVTTIKKAALNLIVKTASEDDVKELRAAFQMIDSDGTGLISSEELKNILIRKRMSANDQEVQDIINQMDFTGNHKINYSEFLAATIDIKNFLTDSKLKAIFKQFDTDNSGYITVDNICLAMQKVGKQMPLNQVLSMIA